MPLATVRATAVDALLVGWILAQITTRAIVARVEQARASNDRGQALSWVVLAVGGAAIAIFVLAKVRDKSETIVNNTCTNADPTTC
jgi:hypothetical protein